MKGPQLGCVRQDITCTDQVAPRGRKASSTLDLKPQTWAQWAVVLLQNSASLAGLSGQWTSCSTLPPLPGGRGQWTFCNTLPDYLGAMGSGTLAIHCFNAWGPWAVDLR